MIRTLMRGYRFAAAAASTLAIGLMLAPAAHASGSSMPSEQPLQQILQSIEGPVAKTIAVIIIFTGLSFAFGASSFFPSFFSLDDGRCGIPIGTIPNLSS
ncbi:TrbC/VIRB2 family protein [Rhodovulum sulfidophilum]|uniref:TrbC/VirB2 family protein n=1 Tax=Rhodovulum sulfidophilum TaxID=35806 RepID=UPI0019238488|nr:TrbC/VirB2 family protein [Rhodovulum sulfidophilum]MBL3594999.1 TrbC/VIRB2 family protein [Rhodovulum sulfidophilum]